MLNVLLVEDSADDRFFFEYAFEKAASGARLFTTSDGVEAIEYLDREARVPARPEFPHLIFLDLKMPECDGFDVLRWMRAHSLIEAVSVFVLSGSAEPQDIQLANELGAKEYLVKPVRLPVLQRLLKSDEFPIISADRSAQA